MRAGVLFLLVASSTGCATAENVPVYQILREDFRRVVEAEGYLRAVTSTPVSVPHSPMGALKVIWIVENGTFVREGDLLVRFDASEIERQIVEGTLAIATSAGKLEQRGIQEAASVSSAERDRSLAELELDAARRFGEKDPEIFSRVQIIESRIDEQLAAERLDHAVERRQTEERLAGSDEALLSIEKSVGVSKVARAREALGALEVRAPHDGVLVLTRDWSGDTVQLGSTSYSGQPIAELPALDRMEAAVHVLEADAGGLREGATAEVEIEGRPEAVYSATIRKVDRMPKPRLRGHPVQYFEAILEIGGAEPGVMKPGQRVRSRLRLDERQEALVVPRQAVFQGTDGSFVYRRSEDSFEKVPVVLGPASLGRIVIESGVTEGDFVAVRDPERSRNELVAEKDTRAVTDGRP